MTGEPGVRGDSGVSDAELTPIYAELGAALHDAQVLEFGLILLMALATEYDQAHFPEGPRESLSPARIGKTLGQLFFAVREREYFTKAEKKMIFKAIRKRNDLIHGYMVDRVQDLFTPDGRRFLVEDIRRTRKALQDADRVNASLIDRYLKEYGTSMEAVERQAREAVLREQDGAD
jgi:hypothetical protein